MRWNEYWPMTANVPSRVPTADWMVGMPCSCLAAILQLPLMLQGHTVTTKKKTERLCHRTTYSTTTRLISEKWNARDLTAVLSMFKCFHLQSFMCQTTAGVCEINSRVDRQSKSLTYRFIKFVHEKGQHAVIVVWLFGRGESGYYLVSLWRCSLEESCCQRWWRAQYKPRGPNMACSTTGSCEYLRRKNKKNKHTQLHRDLFRCW